MAGTLVLQERAARLQEALRRFCEEELKDHEPHIEVEPSGYLDYVKAFVASSAFKGRPYSTRQNELWDYLRNRSGMDRHDLARVSLIFTEEE